MSIKLRFFFPFWPPHVSIQKKKYRLIFVYGTNERCWRASDSNTRRAVLSHSAGGFVEVWNVPLFARNIVIFEVIKYSNPYRIHINDIDTKSIDKRKYRYKKYRYMWGPKRKEEPKLLYFLNLNGFLRFLGKGSLHVYPDYFYFYIKSFTYLYMVSFVNIETPLVLIGHPETFHAGSLIHTVFF